MSEETRVLLVTGSPELATLWSEAWGRGECTEVASPRDAIDSDQWRTARDKPCVVLDRALGSDALPDELIEKLAADAPVILVTERDDDDALGRWARSLGVSMTVPMDGLTPASIRCYVTSCRSSWRAQRILRDEARVSDLIHRLSISLASKLNVGDIVDEIAADAAQLVEAEQGFFLYHRDGADDPSDTTLRRRKLKNSSPPDDDRFFSELDHLIQTSIDTESPVRVDDLYRTQWRGEAPLPDLSGRLRSCLIVPVQDGMGGHFGALVFGHTQPEAFTDRHERLLLGISAAASIALGNAMLFERTKKTARLREELMEILSHDLRNPINAIAIACDELRIAELSADERGRYLGAMRRAIGRCQNLISNLLDVSRIEAGKLSLSRAPVSVRAIVQRVVLDHELSAVQRQVRLVGECSSKAVVELDPERVHQAMSNLVENALEHSIQEGQITVFGRSSQDEVVLGVADQGNGIAPDDLPHVFDRFYQAERERRAGAGLGLAIVKGIASAHGGSVRVDSAVGRGACFELHLPRV